MIKRIDEFLAHAAAMVVAAFVTFSAFGAMAAEQVSLRLDWVNSGYHAIWYYGMDKGIFAKDGIDLTVLQGNGSTVTAQTVGNGSVMFGTADTAAVMGLVSQGMPVKMVAGYLRESPLALIVPASKGWKNFADLQDAKIGWSAGGATSQMLPALLKSAGAKVQLINMEPAAKMTALLTGRVDGIDSFDFLMVPILENKGLKVATLPYADAGVNVPGLSLIASDELIKNNPALVRKMIGAMDASITAARRDPESAIGSLMQRSPTLDRKAQLQILMGSFKLLDPSWAKGKPLAWMSPEIIAKAQDIL
ncbi:MAG: ABC transporter substrate-binding protein, partial [Stellaceae bacterium]